jgi:hypothetical protein
VRRRRRNVKRSWTEKKGNEKEWKEGD